MFFIFVVFPAMICLIFVFSAGHPCIVFLFSSFAAEQIQTKNG